MKLMIVLFALTLCIFQTQAGADIGDGAAQDVSKALFWNIPKNTESTCYVNCLKEDCSTGKYITIAIRKDVYEKCKTMHFYGKYGWCYCSLADKAAKELGVSEQERCDIMAKARSVCKIDSVCKSNTSQKAKIGNNLFLLIDKTPPARRRRRRRFWSVTTLAADVNGWGWRRRRRRRYQPTTKPTTTPPPTTKPSVQVMTFDNAVVQESKQKIEAEGGPDAVEEKVTEEAEKGKKDDKDDDDLL